MEEYYIILVSTCSSGRPSVLGIVDFPTVLLVDICDRAWLAFAGDSKVWESLEEQARRDAAEAEAQGDTDSASDGVLDRYYDCPD